MKKFLLMTLLSCLSFGAAKAQMTLSLDEAIQLALSDNPTIVVAGLEVERYDYVKKQTLASLYPKVDLSGQYSYALRKQEMAEGLSFGGKNTFNATASVSLPLFVPSVYRQLKLNKTQMALAVESARASRIDMVAAVRAAYYNVLLAEQSLKVLEKAVATTQEVVDNTKLLAERGLAAEYDYITAQVQLSNLAPQVLQAKNGIDLTKRQLKMYLSIPEETEISVIGSLDDFRDAVLLGADYEIDLANNTTMKSLELQQELLEHQEKLIQTTRMPTLAAFGQISYIGQEPSDFGGLMGGGAKTSAVTRAGSGSPKFWWQYPISLGAQISIPIFSGFSKTNQLREVRNQQAQLEIQRDYTERGLMLQVQTSVNNLITAREMMMANELTVQQAQKAYEISESRYNAGAGTILELNSSQLTLTQAQLNYSQSIYDYLSAHAEYEKSLGVEYGAQEQVAE